MSARGYLGAGSLYINREVAGSYTGWAGPFECSKFEVKANSELKEMVSKGRETYGQVIESVPIPKPFDLEIVLSEMDKAGLTLALMGTSSSRTQAGGTLTAEAVVTKAGVWVPLSKQNLTAAALTVTNTAVSATYVEGTDYMVNRRLGWIQHVVGGAITDAQSIKVTAAYAAITSDLIAGATQTSVRAKFRLDGINFADSLPTIVDVFEAVISAQAAVDFLSDNFNSVPLKGRMKTPAGQTTPFTVERQLA
jgi:hypothetical protein